VGETKEDGTYGERLNGKCRNTGKDGNRKRDGTRRK
jgi:hypothetical protein